MFAVDGSFCIKGLPPGQYLLTAELQDWNSSTRLMGFYPGVWKHADAIPVEVKAGTIANGLRFGTVKGAFYTVRFRVVTTDGSPVPWKNLGVAVDSPDRDALAYHESHGVGEDGSYALGGIPPGHSTVSTYFQPDYEKQQMPPGASEWQPVQQEVDISGPTVVTVNLSRKNPSR